MASTAPIANTAEPAGQGQQKRPLQAFWQIVTYVDHTKINGWRALRNTFGVIAPLAAGFALGMPRGGLAMASGALNVSYSDGGDPYLPRAKRMLASTGWCSVAVLLGGLSAHSNTVSVILATVWVFIAGLLVSLGTTAADVGVISTVVLVVYSAQALTSMQALQAAGLALSGGLLQIGLSVALWPVQRYEPERRALAELYTELGKLATRPVEISATPQLTKEIVQAQEALVSLKAETSLSALRYRSLLTQAERIRLSLVQLARLRARMARENANDPAIATIDQYRDNAGQVLATIAESLATGLEDQRGQDRLALGTALAAQVGTAEGIEPTANFSGAVRREAKFQADALGGQLRSAFGLARNTTAAGEAEFEKLEKLQPLWARFNSRLATLRANLNLQSAACRHAVRLAVCVALGDAVGRVIHPNRAYWIPMTIVLVLKPEFTVTFSRGILRIFGTLAGLLLATGLFHFLPINSTTEIVLIAVFTFLMRWIGPANYGIFGIVVSALIVLMIAITGVAPKEVIAARGLNTVIGGAFALVAYALWPTWERRRIPELFAAMLEAYGNSIRSITRKLLDPAGASGRERERTRQRARLARSNVETSIERLVAEPGVSAERIAQANALLASSHRLAHAMIAVEAGIPEKSGERGPVEFERYAEAVEKTLTMLVAQVRGERVVEREFPDLRALHSRMAKSATLQAGRYAYLIPETDRMTNSLNTLREQIATWRGKRADGGVV